MRVVFAVLFTGLLTTLDSTAKADDTAAALLPSTTLVYAEMKAPQKLLATILDHPLRKQVEALEDVKKALRESQYLQFHAILRVIEGQLGMTWREAVEALAAGGVYVAVDARTQGVAVLIRASDRTKMERVRDTLLKFARDDAQQKGQTAPLKSVEYRGVTAYHAGNARMATLGQWWLVTNQAVLGKQIVDAHLDGADKSLATSEHFKAARQLNTKSATAWAFVDIEAVRASGFAKDVFQTQANNPLTELLVEGLQSNLQKTPFATVSLNIDQHRVGLAFATPHQPDWVPEARHFYFGANNSGAAAPLAQVANTVFSLTTYRDIGQMWVRAGDLFNEQINDGIAQAETFLAALFAGRDFGEDILGAIRPQLQIVATRQEFKDRLPQPAYKLPAFALVTRLKDAKKMRPELRRIFISMIGFLNFVGAMEGQPQLDPKNRGRRQTRADRNTVRSRTGGKEIKEGEDPIQLFALRCHRQRSVRDLQH